MNAWIDAHNSWMEYGNRSIPTSYGYSIRLNNGEKRNEDIEAAAQELENLAPGVRERLEKERRNSLTEKENQLLAANRADLDAADYETVLKIDEKLTVDMEDVINEITDPAKKRMARKIEKDRIKAMNYSTTIRRYRDVVNYVYWKTRCEVERQQRAIDARRYLWDANEKYEEADLLGALADYDESWQRWSGIHNDYQVLAEDVTAEDLVDHIKRYRTLLSQLDRDFPPPNFPMLKLVANYPDEFGYTRAEAAQLLKQSEERPSSAEGEQATEIGAAEPSSAAEAASSSESSEAGTAASDLISLTADAAAANTAASDQSATTVLDKHLFLRWLSRCTKKRTYREPGPSLTKDSNP